MESAAEPREPRPRRTRARRVITSESEVESDGSMRWVPAPTGRIPYVLVPPRMRLEAEVSIWGKMEEQWKRMERRVTELEEEWDRMKKRMDRLEAEWNE